MPRDHSKKHYTLFILPLRRSPLQRCTGTIYFLPIRLLYQLIFIDDFIYGFSYIRHQFSNFLFVEFVVVNLITGKTLIFNFEFSYFIFVLLLSLYLLGLGAEAYSVQLLNLLLLPPTCHGICLLH